MSQEYKLNRTIAMGAITEVINNLIESVESDCRNMVHVIPCDVNADKEALHLWSERLIRYGMAILRYAKGIAVMRQSDMIETADISAAFNMVNKSIHKDLLGEDEEPTSW